MKSIKTCRILLCSFTFLKKYYCPHHHASLFPFIPVLLVHRNSRRTVLFDNFFYLKYVVLALFAMFRALIFGLLVKGQPFPSLIDVDLEQLISALETGLFNSVELTTVCLLYLFSIQLRSLTISRHTLLALGRSMALFIWLPSSTRTLSLLLHSSMLSAEPVLFAGMSCVAST